jgi:branched-chain amino acid transport system substrate-binding protein
MTSKSLSLIALALASVVAAGPGFAQQPIRIGASIAVTGRDKVQGGYVREGYLLCQKHVNEKGGVLGRPIEFLIRDDASDPKIAVGLYEKLITDDKVDAVLGPYGSASTNAVADVTEKHRTLMIAPAAGTTSIWEKGRVRHGEGVASYTGPYPRFLHADPAVYLTKDVRGVQSESLGTPGHY